jgi:ABC-type glycerol-3-phosphate transport system substrate-binding protein
MISTIRTRRLLCAAAVSFTVLAAAACSSSSDTDTEAVAFTAEDGTFTAEFPNQPKRDTQSQSAGGVNLEIVIYTSEVDNGAVTVTYTDSPVALDADAALAGAVQGSATQVKGTVTSSNDTTFLGYPAKDAEISVDGGDVYERIFLVGQRLYVIGAASGKGRPDAYDRLLETFKLT